MIEGSHQGGASQQRALARAQSWAATRTHAASEYPLERILAMKGDTTVSVVIPAKSVAATIVGVAGECVALREAGAVDEVLVIDANSPDDTAVIAEQAGATVHPEDALLTQYGAVLGKGDALWRSLSVATGKLVVFVDGDTEGFGRHFVTGLIGPLLDDPQIRLVKGSFRRPFKNGDMRVADGGGRVNELAARPLLNVFFPELAAVNQPLAGELAARRDALVQLPFCTGYGTEIQLLIDFYMRFGLDAIAQTNLGERINSHQPLHDLGAMAFAVTRAVLARVEELELEYADHGEFLNYVQGELRVRDSELTERPPANLLEPTGAGSFGVSDGA
ncbi:MAG: glucosyl-3-phosphoglycerate synthase [Solirubrobacterales bacterium]